jgi:signal transduction histidine kinase/ligand-binding sensor domain-containing protein/DNA-binding response OmpR family regulator
MRNYRFPGAILLLLVYLPASLFAGGNPQAPQASQAPQVPQVKYLGIEQGLSNNAVTCIYQDAKGFMWFGTYDGLNRYDGYGFKIYRNIIGDSNSLSCNNLASISADDHGNLWLGSLKGINVFDPLSGRFSIPWYTSWDGRVTWRMQENVHTLASASSGRYLMAGTHSKGLLVFDVTLSRPGRQVPLPGLSGDPGNYDVSAIEFDRTRGIVWVFVQGKGLYTYNLEKGTMRAVTSAIQYAFCMRVDNAGGVWLGTDNGLQRLQEDGLSYSGNCLTQKTRVVAINVNRRNDLYLGTDGAGVWKLCGNRSGNIGNPGSAAGSRGDEGQANPLLSPDGTPLVNSNAVYAVYEDAEGRQWVGTLRGGINVIEPGTRSFKTVTYDPPGRKNIVNNFIMSFCEDADRNVWIGTDGAGLRYWNRKTNSFRDFVNDPSDNGSINSNFITGILRDEANVLWVATWFGGVNRLDRATGKFEHLTCYNPEKNIEEKHIWTILEDKQKRIWASATNDGSLYTYNRGAGRFELFDGRVQNLQSLTEDNEGQLWGGDYSSLIRIDPDRKAHQTFSIGYPVRCLHEDKAGQFWVGTQEGGLLLFDRASGHYKRYTTEDGLPSNTILRILEDAHGNLWMSTYNGLSELQRPEGKFRNFSLSDGLQSAQFSFNAAVSLSSGELLFGGIRGFNIFFPDSIQGRKVMPPVYLTQLRVQNEAIQGDSKFVTGVTDGEVRELTVPFNHAMVSVDFAALEYNGADKINYAYSLTGWDKGWSYANGSRTANYSSIREGSYVFKIRVSHADGTWSPEKELLRLIVLPPWYRTWWAYLLFASVAIGIVILYISYSRSKLRLRYEVQLAQLETEKEKELIERKLSFFTHITHEFRNPLTLIINPVRELLSSSQCRDEQDSLSIVHRNAQRLLSLVDQLLLFRKTESGSEELKPVQVNIVSLAREVYLCFVEGARARKIQYRLDCCADDILLYVDKVKIEIALYNLLSNALKYTPEGGEVCLSICETAGEVSLRVSDTGLGIPPEIGDQVFDKFYQIRRPEMTSISGFGIGLYLVKQFVLEHKGRISYSSGVGTGTSFLLRFLKGKEHLEGISIGGGAQGPSSLFREIAEKTDHENEEAVFSDLVTDRRSLLIVDDDPQILSYVNQIFEKQFVVHKALSGEEGILMAREHRPDLVISDLHMEGISGIELCETIKNDPLLGQTPVILLTASASANNKLEGVRHGADDYITKPFDRDLLVARVCALLQSRERVERSIYNMVTHGDGTARISAEDKEFLEKIIAAVENHLEEEDFSIKRLSLDLGMSHSTMYQRLKEVSGQSVNGFIRFIRLRKAAELFINTNHNVNEVAVMVGIGDGKYFREQFHKIYGLNPSEYIKKYRKGFAGKFQLNRREFNAEEKT